MHVARLCYLVAPLGMARPKRATGCKLFSGAVNIEIFIKKMVKYKNRPLEAGPATLLQERLYGGKRNGSSGWKDSSRFEHPELEDFFPSLILLFSGHVWFLNHLV
jgi:hypothetical protein